MGDWDYGRANGLWGQDGIPYDVKYETRTAYSIENSNYKSNKKSKRYNTSEQLAYNCGFRAVYDPVAYNGRYFVKNGKKWVHNLKALKVTLGISNEYKLKQLAYDIDAYYKYNN